MPKGHQPKKHIDQKCGKEMNRYFPKEASRHMKRCSSLIIREMHFEMRYLTAVRMSYIQNTGNKQLTGMRWKRNFLHSLLVGML